MYLVNENNNEMYEMYTRDKVNVLNTFLVYYTFAALKFTGKYTRKNIRAELFLLHLFLFITVILRHIQQGSSRATLHQREKDVIQDFY
jgi:hypothetical protein